MSDAFQWATADQGAEPPDAVYCGTRDVAVARLGAFRSVAEHQGVTTNMAALIAAIAGELTNNCFDHPGTAFLLRTGAAQLAFRSPITTEEIPHAIQSADVTVPGTYAAFTVPEIQHIVGSHEN